MLEDEITLACNITKEGLADLAKRDEEKYKRTLFIFQKEKELIKESFFYFLKYAKIVEPPTKDTVGGVIEMELWPHLKQLAHTLLTELLITVFKSRQVGVSWFVAAYVLWYGLTHIGPNIMLFSKGETEAMELLSKCKRIYNELPIFLKYKLNPDSLTEMGFPTLKSSIKAFPATTSAGISYTSSIVVTDEHEAHPNAEDNFFAAKPTIDAGGQYISVSTIDLEKSDTLAQTLFKSAWNDGATPMGRIGPNGFVPLFFPYWVRPGRDEEWYKRTEASIPAVELRGLTPQLYMHKNYPRSIEEMFTTPSTIAVFDGKVLNSMSGKVDNPIKDLDPELDDRIVHIYRDFLIGEYYIAATDTAHGVGKDYSVTCVMNVKTGDIVADICDNNIPPEELAMWSVRLLKRFKDPLWYIESNDLGGMTIATAKRLGYRHFGYHDEKKQKVGFNTTGFLVKGQLKGTRNDLWCNLIPAVNNHQITIYNAQGLRQFYDIIRDAKNEGRIGAKPGRNDDYPITVGICWLKKDEVQTSPFDYTPLETLHFPGRDEWNIGNPTLKNLYQR